MNTSSASIAAPPGLSAGLPERLSRLIDALPDALLCLDRAWRITYANAEATRISRLEPEHFGSKTHWELFPETLGTPIEEEYRRAMETRQPASLEYTYEPFAVALDIHILPTDEGIALYYRDITPEKIQKAIVQDQNELLAVVQRAARVATWDIDLSNEKIFWGPGSCDVFGHPLSELDSLAALARIFVGARDDIRSKINEAVQSGGTFVTEFAIRAADASILWIETRSQVVAASDGSRRLRGIAIDITERKQNEDRLVASETRYRVLADLNPQAIWMGDPAGNVTYANQGFLAYIGLTAENLKGSGWLEAFAPLDRDRMVEGWTRSVTTGVDYNLEALLRHAPTGDYRYWNLRAAPVRDAAGNILHWLGVGSDIHDAKISAASLRAEQAETERRRAELETIYKTTPVGLALLDPVDFRFLNLNDHEAEMLGYPKEQILGRPLAEIAPIPGLVDLFRFVAEGNVIKDRLIEGELAARPGERRAWSVNYAPIFNEDGSVRAISTASIEITNQKKAEAALLRSEKLAAVGRLASSISHEINNPLEAITNLLYLIALDGKLPPELKTYVHMAQSELSRVSQIATQTLRFHRQAVAPTAVNAADLVNAVIRLYTGRLANSSIKVDVRYDTQTPVVCFENDIRQVLNNLIANAIDAMRKGGRLIVRAHQACGPDGGTGVRITIADTGHGMSKEVVARLFEPFFTTKDLNGTGLGLWISHGIVERHHGRLRVRSSANPQRHGSVFTLFLPRQTRPSAAPATV